MRSLPKATIRDLMLLLSQHGGSRIMACSQNIELTASLQEAFPPALLLALARESRLVIRERKFNPVLFFWALMSTIIGGEGTSVASVKVEYERLARKRYDSSTFYERVGSEAMVRFLRLCFAHACKHVFPESSRPAFMRRFVDVLLQDSSVVRLRDKLAGRLPGSATPAALKVNVIVNLGGGKPSKVQISKGTKAETKFAVINKSLAGSLLIADLGYFKYQHFARIQDNEGFFLARLKDNANPMIVGSHLVHRGRALDLAGKPLREVLTQLERAVLDVAVEVEVDMRGKPGRRPEDGNRLERRNWRVVGLLNAETGEYHLYLTNIPPEMLTAEEIGLAYSLRWEVELLFKEMKGCYDLGAWAVATEEGVMAQTYAVLIAWALSRKLRSDIVGAAVIEDSRAASLAAPLLRFSKVLAHHIGRLIEWMLARRRAPRHLLALLRKQVRDPNRGRQALIARSRRVPRNAPVAAYAA